MSRNRPAWFVPVAVAVFMLYGWGRSGESQIVPFQARGAESTYNPFTAYTEATGNATHLGALTASGYAVPQPTGNPLVLAWTAEDFQFTAANGDQIFVEGSGFVNLIPLDSTFTVFTAVWSADFTVTGGTGRFAQAGPGPTPLRVTAVNNPFAFPPSPGDIWTYTWSINGPIDLGKASN